MFKKHMTPLSLHRKGNLVSSPNKGSDQRSLAGAGGGMAGFGGYGKATPMASSDQPQPDDSPFGGLPGA